MNEEKEKQVKYEEMLAKVCDRLAAGGKKGKRLRYVDCSR